MASFHMASGVICVAIVSRPSPTVRVHFIGQYREAGREAPRLKRPRIVLKTDLAPTGRQVRARHASSALHTRTCLECSLVVSVTDRGCGMGAKTRRRVLAADSHSPAMM